MAIQVTISGVRELQAVLLAAAERADTVTRVATVAATAIVETAAKDQLRRSSHPKRTPTPSAPGSPPSLITGNLMRSVTATGPTGGLGTYTASIGPTSIYGRIQELGGTTGRGHATVLPARPYMDPALASSTTEIQATYLSAWSTIFG